MNQYDNQTYYNQANAYNTGNASKSESTRASEVQLKRLAEITETLGITEVSLYMLRDRMFGSSPEVPGKSPLEPVANGIVNQIDDELNAVLRKAQVLSEIAAYLNNEL